MQSCFHLAFHVHSLEETRQFYVGQLGCAEGRSTDTWIDFDFFGHQLSAHLGAPFSVTNTGKVEAVMVPMPHFGVVLSMDDWRTLAKRIEDAGINFVLKPSIRFAGLAGEQGTMFFKDPSGNPIEIKGFSDASAVFAT
jgi:uncharacterized protein